MRIEVKSAVQPIIESLNGDGHMIVEFNPALPDVLSDAEFRASAKCLRCNRSLDLVYESGKLSLGGALMNAEKCK